MPAGSTIQALWHRAVLPIRDALHVAPGRSYDVYLLPNSGMKIGPSFDLDAQLRADPDWLTSIDVHVERDTGAGFLFGGEGSHGSEGIFGSTTARGDLLWVVYFETSNPFLDITLHERRATFRSTAGVNITLDVDGLSWSRDANTG